MSRLLPIGHTWACVLVYIDIDYGVATISRLIKIIGFFCKRDLYKRLYSAKETYDLIVYR